MPGALSAFPAGEDVHSWPTPHAQYTTSHPALGSPHPPIGLMMVSWLKDISCNVLVGTSAFRGVVRPYRTATACTSQLPLSPFPCNPANLQPAPCPRPAPKC